MRITLADCGEWPSLETIKALPTLHEGQYADLKIEDYFTARDGRMILVRYWLNRVGPAEGEAYRVVVEARECPDGSWQDVGYLYPYSRHHTAFMKEKESPFLYGYYGLR